MGGGTFWTTIGRKISTNLSLLGSSLWSDLLPVIGGFVVIVYLFGGRWERIMPKGSRARIGLIGLVIVAALGYALNDSGALAAALVFVYLGAYVGLPALEDPRAADVVLEPVEAPA